MNNQEKLGWQTVCQYGLLVVFLLGSVVLQTLAKGGISLFGVSLLPAVAFVIGIAMNYGALHGGVFGLVTGLLLDVYTTPSVGFQVGMMTFLGIACGLCARHLFMHNRYARGVLCFCSCLVYCTAYFVVIKWICGGYDFSYFYLFSLPMAGVSTLTALVYTLGLKWFRGYW